MKIKGKNYKLIYNNRSLYEIEKMSNTPILKLIQDSDRMQSIETMAIFISAGIDELTFDDVLDGMDFTDAENIGNEMATALNEAFDTGSKKK